MVGFTAYCLAFIACLVLSHVGAGTDCGNTLATLFEGLNSGNLKSAVICEGSSGNITCSQSPATKPKKIKLIFADYGRRDATTCKSLGNLYNTNCSSDGDDMRIYDRCNGQTSCEILEVTNSFHNNKDPCVYTSKYLQLIYLCE